MELPTGAGEFHARVNAQLWPHVMLSFFSYGTEVQVNPGDAPFPVFYGVNLPLSGNADVSQRGAQVQSSADTASVLSGAPSSRMRWSPDYTVLCVKIEPTALEQHLSRMSGRRVDRPIEFELGMPLRSSGTAWTGVIQMLIDFAERSADPPPLLTAEVESTVMTTLLLTQPHNYSEVLLMQPSVPGRIVTAAIEVMRSDVAAGLTVAEIAERTGVSERSLQMSFRRQLGVSPTEYLRGLRLDEARRELLAAPADGKSVSRVAVSWGFSNLGRFAAKYHHRFGEYPSQTARRGG
jgi:AraC-like DNA-binding protein